MNVTHDKQYQQFTIKLGDEEAELAYATPSEQVVNFTHTFVPEGDRGQGVADELIKAGLDYAEKNNLKVIPSCPVVAQYMKRHQEYQKLLQ